MNNIVLSLFFFVFGMFIILIVRWRSEEEEEGSAFLKGNRIRGIIIGISFIIAGVTLLVKYVCSL